MRKVKIVVFVLFGLLCVAGIVFVIISYVKPKAAGILIETNPESTVYLEGEYVGRTPFKTTKKPGELLVKLIPDSFGAPLVPYETKLQLVSGVETVLRRDFAGTMEGSSGEVVSFEKVGKGETSLAVVTVPDSAQIELDGGAVGFAPFKTTDTLPGEHVMTIRAEGYKEHSLKIRMYDGYKLTAVITLAKEGVQGTTDENPSPSVTPSPTDAPSKTMIEVSSTPTGYLRVRKEASTLAEEIGRVFPGKLYLFISEDAKTGWYQIEFEESKNGWISNEYAKKVDSGGTSTLKISVSPTPTTR